MDVSLNLDNAATVCKWVIQAAITLRRSVVAVVVITATFDLPKSHRKDSLYRGDDAVIQTGLSYPQDYGQTSRSWSTWAIIADGLSTDGKGEINVNKSPISLR
jgi:hypothetical protein